MHITFPYIGPNILTLRCGICFDQIDVGTALGSIFMKNFKMVLTGDWFFFRLYLQPKKKIASFERYTNLQLCVSYRMNPVFVGYALQRVL